MEAQNTEEPMNCLRCMINKWTALPCPSAPSNIRNLHKETIWEGHAIMGRKVLLVACSQDKEKRGLYYFDFDTVVYIGIYMNRL